MVVCYNVTMVFSNSIQGEYYVGQNLKTELSLHVLYSEEVKSSLGIDKKVIEKRFQNKRVKQKDTN